MPQPRLLAFSGVNRTGRWGNFLLATGSPLIGGALAACILRRMALVEPATNAHVFFAPLVLLLYLTSGPMWACVAASVATLSGQIFFLLTQTAASKLIFAGNVGMVWIVFYLMYAVHRLTRNTQSRIDEEYDHLDMEVGRLSSDAQKIQEDLQDLRERTAAYDRLHTFTDDLVGAYTREELLNRSRKGLEALYPGAAATLRFFARPNSASLNDDWGHRVLSYPQPRLYVVRKSVSPSAKAGTFMLLPLKSKDGMLGWAGLEKKSRRRLFDVPDLRLAMIASDLIALAVGNADLYNETEAMAVTDSLTGLYTRRHFSERFQEEFAKSRHAKKPLSLLLFDVDHFKGINDTHGHHRGDDVLRWLSRTVSAHVRETDFAARYGGDEFIILMPLTTATRALELAHRLFQSVARSPLRWGEEKITVTLSGGVAALNPQTENELDMLRLADEALYRAKTGGRNRVVKAE